MCDSRGDLEGTVNLMETFQQNRHRKSMEIIGMVISTRVDMFDDMFPPLNRNLQPIDDGHTLAKVAGKPRCKAVR